MLKKYQILFGELEEQSALWDANVNNGSTTLSSMNTIMSRVRYVSITNFLFYVSLPFIFFIFIDHSLCFYSSKSWSFRKVRRYTCTSEVKTLRKTGTTCTGSSLLCVCTHSRDSPQTNNVYTSFRESLAAICERISAIYQKGLVLFEQQSQVSKKGHLASPSSKVSYLLSFSMYHVNAL